VRERLDGVFPPIPTVFDEATGAVDRAAIAANVQRWMKTKLAGILALGSNGESALLDDDECDVVVATVRSAMPADRLLLAGTGRESTRATIAASRRAADHGADAVLVRPPFFFKNQMTPDALVAHFTAVADASPVPVLLYDLPGVTGISFTLATVETLSAHPNIVGMKETSPDLERLGQFTAIRPGFRVLCGWAPVVYPAFVAGATGAILALANVAPRACVALYDLTRGGRHSTALELQRALTPLARLVTSVHGIAGLKAALDLEGYRGGPVRPPLLPLPARARDEIAQALAALGSQELE
jgi:4-hydroxy-2-oxoglutarate aldolase